MEHNLLERVKQAAIKNERLATIYERHKNVDRAAHLRATANLLWHLAYGGNPSTIYPDENGRYED